MSPDIVADIPDHDTRSPVVVQRKVGQRSQGADRLPGVPAAVQLVAACAQVGHDAEAAQPRRQARQPVAAQVRSLRGACGSGGRGIQHARSLPAFCSTLAGLNARRGRACIHALLQAASGPHRCSAPICICRCLHLWVAACQKGDGMTERGRFYSPVWYVPLPTAPLAPLAAQRPASTRCPFCPRQPRAPAPGVKALVIGC